MTASSTPFDRARTREVHARLGAALKTLGDELGVTIGLTGSVGYDDQTMTFKVAVTQRAADGAAVDLDAVNFRRLAAAFGLAPDDLGKPFTSRGRRFTIVGLNPSARTYPIVAANGGGKRFRFTIEAVKAGLSRPEAVAPGTPLRAVQRVSLDANGRPIIPGLTTARRTDAEIIRAIRRIDADLSPENLHQDGERSNAEACRIGASLRRERARLVAELGREPTGEELYAR